MPSPAYATKEDEYWYNVSPQDALPIAGQIDLDIDLDSVAKFFATLAKASNTTEAHGTLVSSLIASPLIFSHARQFLGLSDKRAYLELSYLASRTPHPTQATSLSGCHPWTLSRHPMAFFLRLLSGSQGRQVQIATADMVASYLIEQGLYEAAKGFSGMEPALMELVYTRLITPKEYQQKAAKRRGHGCEAALAAVLQACGLHIRPESKATNPMGSTDPHINLSSMDISERTVGTTHAFDMVVLAKSRLRIGIQCLIHTSDPGQYGVDKSNETVQIADKINTWNARHAKTEQVELWGLVDGVGFSENKPDTINKLLRNFHYFIQLNTLYKGPLRAHALGLTTIKAIRFSTYYDSEDIASIRSLYVPDNVTLLSEADSPPSGATAIPAGEATIYV